jgi:hypothetical protein
MSPSAYMKMETDPVFKMLYILVVSLSPQHGVLEPQIEGQPLIMEVSCEYIE